MALISGQQRSATLSLPPLTASSVASCRNQARHGDSYHPRRRRPGSHFHECSLHHWLRAPEVCRRTRRATRRTWREDRRGRIILGVEWACLRPLAAVPRPLRPDARSNSKDSWLFSSRHFVPKRPSRADVPTTVLIIARVSTPSTANSPNLHLRSCLYTAGAVARTSMACRYQRRLTVGLLLRRPNG